MAGNVLTNIANNEPAQCTAAELARALNDAIREIYKGLDTFDQELTAVFADESNVKNISGFAKRIKHLQDMWSKLRLYEHCKAPAVEYARDIIDHTLNYIAANPEKTLVLVLCQETASMVTGIMWEAAVEQFVANDILMGMLLGHRDNDCGWYEPAYTTFCDAHILGPRKVESCLSIPSNDRACVVLVEHV